VRPDTGEEQLRADIKQCARGAEETSDPLEWRFERCMRSRGYSKARKGR
jgi:hypothetical protein